MSTTTKKPMGMGGVGYRQVDQRVANQISSAHIDVPTFTSGPTDAQWVARYNVSVKVGDQYYDSTQTKPYVCTAAGTTPTWTLIGAGGSGSTSTIQQIFANGKEITGADSSTNALKVGNGTDYIRLYRNAANDIRIDSQSGETLTIAPNGGTTAITGALTVSTNITTTSGTITNTSGNIVATAGNLVSTLGDIIATAGNITDTLGNITATEGNIVATKGNITATEGNITATLGNIVATAGNITVTNGVLAVNNTGAASADLVDITRSNSATAGDAIDIDMGSGTGSGDAIDISWGGAGTGEALNINMTNNVAGAALKITGAGTRTDALIDIADSSGGAGAETVYIAKSAGAASMVLLDNNGVAGADALEIDHDGQVTGRGIYVHGAAWTGAANEGLVDVETSGSSISAGKGLIVNLANTGKHASALAGSAVTIADAATAPDSGTSYAVSIDATNIEALHVVTGKAVFAETVTVTAGDIVASSGEVDISGSAGANDLLDITKSNTATNGHGIDISMGTAAVAGNAVNIAFGAGISTGDALNITMGSTNVAGSPIVITEAGARTDSTIKITDTSTSNAPNIDINVDSVRTGNGIDITYGTAAATENAIDLNMGTNVVGQAIDVASAATGTTDKGAILHAAHTGNLGAGCDLVHIASTGSPSSTSNLVSIEQSSGAGTAGSYALYVSATGTNVEGLNVAAGTSTFAEGITCAGRMTTTDGVGSGTAKVIGGRLYANVADGTELTNSTDETKLGGATIPANTLKSGSVVKVWYSIRCDEAQSTDTLAVNVKLGAADDVSGTALQTIAAVNATTDDIITGFVLLKARAAAGATAAIVSHGHYSTLAAVGVGTFKSSHTATANYATNAALYLNITGTWSVAHGDNRCSLEDMYVEVI